MEPDINKVDKVYGLIGYPLVHSFSKDYFNQKFQSENISAVYINFEIDDINNLMEVISEYPTLDGLNVTAPYKEQVIPFLDSLDDGAKAIGAVNVIRFVRGSKENDFKLVGYNSDAIGFSMSIQPLLNPKRDAALVLGTGGASKAVTYALEHLGVKVTHVSRHKSANTVAYEELTKAMVLSHKIVVDATPLGMYPNVDTAPDFPYRFLTPEHLCYDLVYNPDETLFMKNSKKYGAQVKNGLEMLLLQAFVSYEIWTKGKFTS
jgi:shikimate dehydrogenase